MFWFAVLITQNDHHKDDDDSCHDDNDNDYYVDNDGYDEYAVSLQLEPLCPFYHGVINTGVPSKYYHN